MADEERSVDFLFLQLFYRIVWRTVFLASIAITIEFTILSETGGEKPKWYSGDPRGDSWWFSSNKTRSKNVVLLRSLVRGLRPTQSDGQEGRWCYRVNLDQKHVLYSLKLLCYLSSSTHNFFKYKDLTYTFFTSLLKAMYRLKCKLHNYNSTKRY